MAIFFTKNVTIDKETVTGMWEVFKVQKLTGYNYYANEGKFYSHFVDWLKLQKFENGTNKQINSSRGARQQLGAEQLISSIKDDLNTAGGKSN